MISKVILNGWKGLVRTYALAGPTVLCGPNGSGKSACLEAIAYALSGKVKAGKTLEAVSSYFRPEGGTVKLVRDDGAWLERGLNRNPRTGKCSATLEASGRKLGKEVDLTGWQADAAVLNLAELLSLSPEQRRAYVLDLCGSGSVEAPEALIGLFYAREIGGPGTTPGGLNAAGGDLPDEVRALWGLWGTTIQGALVLGAAHGPGSVPGWVQTAREAKLEARRGASLYCASLETAGAPKPPDSAVAEGLRIELEHLETEAERQGEQRAALEEAKSALHRCHGHVKTAKEAAQEASVKAKLLGTAAAPPDPGPEPEDVGVASLEQEILEAVNLREETKAKLARRAANEAGIAMGREDVQAAQAEIAILSDSPIARLMALVDRTPDDAHENMPGIREAAKEMAKGWRAAHSKWEARRDAAWAALESLKAPASAETVEQLQHRLGVDEERVKRYAAKRDGAKVECQNRRAAWRKMERAKLEHAQALEKAGEAVRYAEKHLALQEAVYAEVSERVRALEGDTLVDQVLDEDLDPVAVKARIESIRSELRTFDEALGRERTLEDSRRKVAEFELLERAWKAAEAAASAVREKLIGGAAQPLMAALGDLLARAGRKEKPYLELQNEKGRAIFELGWTLGSGERIPFEALSGGEGAIFAAGLSAAIALLSPGLKLLLIEADTLDAGNFCSMLQALAPLGPELDALCLSSCHESEREDNFPEGWTEISLT